jgi:hypothetical protein
LTDSTPAKPHQSNGTLPIDSKNDSSISNIGPSESQVSEIGPVVGPSGPPESLDTATGDALAPQSPYSTERALLRDLTLPSMPDLDIPPSPPGSPSSATTAKFANFRKLKQQGNHFNERLAKSAALKNPGFAQKLMDFAGISAEDQYATSLPESLWNPNGFPTWAYKDALAESQRTIARKLEEERSQEQREAIEFVPSTPGESSRGGTPGIGSKGPGRSAAERIMAGLDRGKAKSPLVSGGLTRHREAERKIRRFESKDGPRRSRSRSPQQLRRRSRSR